MVRLAVMDDIDSIKKIADKYSREIGFVIRSSLVESCNARSLLVKIFNNQIIGFCNFHHRRDGVNVIYELCVSEEYRRRGFAKELINAIPKPIRLKCPVDNDSNKFYQNIGARLVETVPGKKRDLNVYEIGDIYSIGLLN